MVKSYLMLFRFHQSSLGGPFVSTETATAIGSLRLTFPFVGEMSNSISAKMTRRGQVRAHVINSERNWLFKSNGGPLTRRYP